MTIRELLLKIGFEIDDTAEKEINQAIKSIVGTTQKAVEDVKNLVNNSAQNMEASISNSGETAADVAANAKDAVVKASNEAKDSVNSATDEVKKNIEEVGNTAENTAKKSAESVASTISTIKKVFKSVASITALIKANAIAEEMQRANLQLQTTANILGDVGDVQGKVMDTSVQLRQSYSDTVSAVTNLANSNARIFQSTEQATKFYELTTKVWKTAGKSQSEVSSLNSTMVGIFKEGKLSLGTYQSLLESSPETIDILCQSLGKSRKDLKAMATAGVISAKKVNEAFLESAEDINKAFSKTPATLSEVKVVAQNVLGEIIGEINDTLGITKHLSQIALGFLERFRMKGRDFIERLKNITDKVGGTENAFSLLTIAVGAFIAISSGSKILKFFESMKKITGILTVANLKTTALVAGIVLLILIFQDIVSFAQGKDSILGRIFENMGWDSEKARENLKKFADTIKTVFTTEKGKQAVGWVAFFGLFFKNLPKLQKMLETFSTSKLFGKLSNILGKGLGGSLKKGLGGIGSKIKNIGPKILPGIKAVGKGIGNVFTKMWAFLGLKGTLIVALIIAIVAAVIYCYKNWDKIGPKVKEVIDKIVTGFQGVIDWFKALPENARTWGKDMLQNFINGIEERFPFLSDIIKKITGEVDDNLGHSVPKKGPLKDDNKWMPDFMDNLTNGIKGKLPEIRSVIKTLAGEFEGISDLNIASNKTLSVTANAAKNKGVVQNNTFNNTFNGSDREQQRNTSKAMNSAAGTATKAMARAIAYAR